MARKLMRKLRTFVFGDCSYCGHSIIYHAPLAGCLKCSCDEFE